jgi:hypothetical protein
MLTTQVRDTDQHSSLMLKINVNFKRPLYRLRITKDSGAKILRTAGRADAGTWENADRNHVGDTANMLRA